MTVTIDLYWLCIVPGLVLISFLYKSFINYKNKSIDSFCYCLLDLLKNKNWEIKDGSISTHIGTNLLQIYPFAEYLYWQSNKSNASDRIEVSQLKGIKQVMKKARIKYSLLKNNKEYGHVRLLEQLINQELRGKI